MYNICLFPNEKCPLYQLSEFLFVLMTAFLNLKQHKQGFCCFTVTHKQCAYTLTFCITSVDQNLASDVCETLHNYLRFLRCILRALGFKLSPVPSDV